MFTELRDTCHNIKEKMGRQLFRTVANGHVPSFDDLIDENTQVRLKRMLYAWRSSPLPTIVTHDLYDDGNDPVLRHLRHRQLLNMPEDRVKVIFHPEFVTATSPLIALDYDDFVRGCHLGFFPSYYEPWGYTPLECVVSGVPAISSDLSGFGDYVMENFPDHDENGMFIAPRRRVSFGETVARCVDWLHQLTRMNRRERIALRNKAESHAEAFDWENLGRHYVDAWNMALRRHYPARAATIEPTAAPAKDPPVASEVSRRRPSTSRRGEARKR
jgi:glycogen(starch) synthase